MSESGLSLGTQYLIEIRGCRADKLGQVSIVEADMRAAARAIGATVLSGHFHQFEPHGVSGALIISESHFAVHTWPEHGYAALDLFTCGPVRLHPSAAVDLLRERWGAETVQQQVVERG